MYSVAGGTPCKDTSLNLLFEIIRIYIVLLAGSWIGNLNRDPGYVACGERNGSRLHICYEKASTDPLQWSR